MQRCVHISQVDVTTNIRHFTVNSLVVCGRCYGKSCCYVQSPGVPLTGWLTWRWQWMTTKKRMTEELPCTHRHTHQSHG